MATERKAMVRDIDLCNERMAVFYDNSGSR